MFPNSWKSNVRGSPLYNFLTALNAHVSQFLPPLNFFFEFMLHRVHAFFTARLICMNCIGCFPPRCRNRCKSCLYFISYFRLSEDALLARRQRKNRPFLLLTKVRWLDSTTHTVNKIALSVSFSFSIYEKLLLVNINERTVVVSIICPASVQWREWILHQFKAMREEWSACPWIDSIFKRIHYSRIYTVHGWRK